MVMVNDCFDTFLDQTCKYFIKNLCIYVHQRCCNFVIFIALLSVWNPGNAGIIEAAELAVGVSIISVVDHRSSLNWGMKKSPNFFFLADSCG